MEYFAFEGACLARPGYEPLPPGALRVDGPFEPTIYLFHNLAPEAGGLFAQAGRTLLNTAYANCYGVLKRHLSPPASPRLNLVGLGDVGGTVLTGLKLLGHELGEIGIYDPDEKRMARYELELNQVLPVGEGPLPPVALKTEAALFDCDALVFTASRGVPPLGQAGDVRMAQYEANAAMLRAYAGAARSQGFTGLFCQVSDPVDLLARRVFLDSNRQAGGAFDGCGLLPEQVQGYGLGVMFARAAYYARQEGVDFRSGRAFGPHGEGLVIANAPGPGAYDDGLSRRLTDLARTANHRVRDLGFKPYIAPGLSSACASILRTLRGEWHYGAVPIGGVYFGCRSRFGPAGLERFADGELDPRLLERLAESYRALQAFPL